MNVKLVFMITVKLYVLLVIVNVILVMTIIIVFNVMRADNKTLLNVLVQMDNMIRMDSVFIVT